MTKVAEAQVEKTRRGSGSRGSDGKGKGFGGGRGGYYEPESRSPYERSVGEKDTNRPYDERSAGEEDTNREDTWMPYNYSGCWYCGSYFHKQSDCKEPRKADREEPRKFGVWAPK